MHDDSTTRRIPLTQGRFALVDAEDFETVEPMSWHYTAQGYAGTNTGGRKHHRSVLMHRFLLDIHDRFVYADHINHDTLDNRRSNLRVVTPGESMRNTRSARGTSAYKGVHWHKGAGKWRAMIQIDRKSRHIGYFDTETEAAAAYDEKARELFGEYAWLNAGRVG